MPIIRQLPKLCIRGSLANVTMKNLSEDEKEHVSQITSHVIKHPAMSCHKKRIISKFRNTIGQDFIDNSVGTLEFEIAVWKATTELLYHRDYEFYCGCCNSNTYLTKRNTPNIIDREQIPCPNCRSVELISKGDTNLPKGKAELLLDLTTQENVDKLLRLKNITILEIQNVLECDGYQAVKIQDILIKPIYIKLDEFQNSYKYMTNSSTPPECRSSIYYITGKKKYKRDHAQSIINDPTQLTRFYGQFITNYFKQQIVENKRRESKKMETIVNRGDIILVEEILALCKKMNIVHTFCTDNPTNGYYVIKTPGLLTPPEFTIGVLEHLEIANKNSIVIKFDSDTIMIKEDHHATELETKIPRSEHILIIDDTNNEKWSVDDISSKGVDKVDPENHEKSIETAEIIQTIRKSLPEELCKDIFDIYLNTGEKYKDYSTKYGDKIPKKSHLAEFFKTNVKTIKEHIHTIKIQCLAYGFTP